MFGRKPKCPKCGRTLRSIKIPNVLGGEILYCGDKDGNLTQEGEQ